MLNINFLGSGGGEGAAGVSSTFTSDSGFAGSLASFEASGYIKTFMVSHASTIIRGLDVVLLVP